MSIRIAGRIFLGEVWSNPKGLPRIDQWRGPTGTLAEYGRVTLAEYGRVAKAIPQLCNAIVGLMYGFLGSLRES